MQPIQPMSEVTISSQSSYVQNNIKCAQTGLSGHTITEEMNTNLLSCPSDVLCLIQQRLSQSEQKNLYETCKYLLKTKEKMMLLDPEGCLKRMIRHSITSRLPLSTRLLETFQKIFKNRKLEFEYTSFSENAKSLDSKILLAVANVYSYWGSYFYGLPENFYEPTEKLCSFSTLLPHFQKAKILKISYTNIDDGTLEQAKMMPDLQEIVIKNCPNLAGKSFGWLSSLKNLQSFELTSCRAIDNERYLEILHQLPADISVLKIGYFPKYNLNSYALHTTMLVGNNRVLGMLSNIKNKNFFAKFTKLKVFEITFQHMGEHLKMFPEDLSSLDILERFSLPRGYPSTVLKYLMCENTLKFLNLPEPLEAPERLEAVEKFTHLEYLNLSQCRLSEDACASLGKLTLLTSLHLDGCGIQEEGLRRLLPLQNLEVLTLSDSGLGIADTPRITDRFLELLSEFPKLRSLDISSSWFLLEKGFEVCSEFSHLVSLDLSGNDGARGTISDEMLKTIARICPRLEHLNLTSRTAVTCTGLSFLKELKNLRFIELGGCTGIGKEGLEILATIDTLERISLWFGIRVGEKEIKALESHTGLKELTLEGVFTDEAFKSISKLKNIEALHLFGEFALSVDSLAHLTHLKNLQNLTLVPATPRKGYVSSLSDKQQIARQEWRNFGLDEEERVCSLTISQIVDLFNGFSIPEQELHFPSNLHLKSLTIYANMLSENGIQNVGVLKGLKRIHLICQKKIPIVIESLSKLHAHTTLVCMNSKIHRDHLQQLVNLRHLAELYFIGHELTTDDLSFVQNLKCLEYLTVSETIVTRIRLPRLQNIIARTVF